MKHFSKAGYALMLLVTGVLMVSCNQQQDAGNNSPVAEKKIAAPAVDIHTAIISDNAEALKQHIAAGSNLDEKEPMGGSTPLISASLFGKTAMAKLLIEAGADLNIRNNDGSTALHTAAFFCRPEIVKMLLDKQADKTIKNNYGQTAYGSVAGNFASVKPAYEALGKMLEPMGLKLEHAYLEKTRPEIAAMLQ